MVLMMTKAMVKKKKKGFLLTKERVQLKEEKDVPIRHFCCL